MSDAPAFDESIPVLTEVVQDPAPVQPIPSVAEVTAALHADDIPVLAPEDAIVVPVQDAASAASAAPAPTPAERVGALDDDAWRALEERLVARVLDRLQDRVGLVLEDQVRTSMAPVLDHVVARLATDLRDGLRQTVEQVVERAVAQELAHLKARTG